VREAMTSPCELDGQSILVDVTIGISVAPNDGNDPEQLLKKAEMANQGAKSEQRGSVRVFKPRWMRAPRRATPWSRPAQGARARRVRALLSAPDEFAAPGNQQL